MDGEPVIWEAKDAPSIKMVRNRYREAGLFDWDTKRVKQLCQQIKCTEHELCAVAGVFDGVDRLMNRKSNWPVYLTIHFARAEHFIHRAKFRFEPQRGPGPEDIAMAKLIARGQEAEKAA